MDSIQLDAGWFSSDGGAYIAWGIAQNVANTFMIIILLLVIFSQLTGWGIDNYGIKKMLPKLVVMAILVNLSFLICQLAVDLSNIVGNGVVSLGKNVANQITAGAGSASILEYGASGLLMIVFTAAGTAATVGSGVITAVSLTNAPLAIIVIVALVILVLVAVVIFWAAIALRNLFAILAVILAPLALVCYILPNTQNLFKKWRQMFEATIIVYPVCGGVYAISKILAAISGTNEYSNVFMIVIAWIFQFVPFFLAPLMIKKLLSLVGEAGGVFNNLLGRARSGIGRAQDMAKTTGRYQARQADIAAQRKFQTQQASEQRAQRTIGKLNAQAQKVGGRRNLSQGQQARLLNAEQTLNQSRMQNADARAGVPVISTELADQRADSRLQQQEIKNYTDQYDALTKGQMETELASAVTAYNEDRSEENTNRLQAAIIAAENKGMYKEMLAQLGGTVDENGNQVGGLALQSANADGTPRRQDSRILSQMAGSQNKLISQFGKQMSKPANAQAQASLGDFARSQGTVRMSTAFQQQGANVLNNMDDDTLEFIKNNGGAVTTEQLIQAAGATTNEKELRQINEMLAGRNDYQMSMNQLGKLSESTVRAINDGGNANSLYGAALGEIRETRASDSTRQVVNNMSQNVRQILGLGGLAGSNPTPVRTATGAGATGGASGAAGGDIDVGGMDTEAILDWNLRGNEPGGGAGGTGGATGGDNDGASQ